MKPYLFHCEGVGAIVNIPDKYTSEQWGVAQDAFICELGHDPTVTWIDCIQLYPDYIAEGVRYTWHLAGPDGARFWLIKMPDTTAEQIERAKAKLRRDQDVVRIDVIRIKKMVEFTLP
jgi:hypothetical protein